MLTSTYTHTHTVLAGQGRAGPPRTALCFSPLRPRTPGPAATSAAPTSNKCPEAERSPTRDSPAAAGLLPQPLRAPHLIAAPRPPTRRPPPQARSPPPPRALHGPAAHLATLTWQRAPWQRPAPALAPARCRRRPAPPPLLLQSLPPPGPITSSSHEAAAANQRLPPAPARRAPEGRAARAPRCFLGDAGGPYREREG